MTSNRGAAVGLDREMLADLVGAIVAAQDRDAFVRLFNHFAPRVKGYLLRLGANPGQADELTQETMLTLWHRAATFDRRQSSVSTWVFTIARNKRIDALRRDRRAEIDPNDPMLVPAGEAQADEIYQIAQSEDRLRQAMAELPEEQRALLELAFFQDKSHRDIAAAQSLPLGTVKSRIRLALGRLRKAIEER